MRRLSTSFRSRKNPHPIPSKSSSSPVASPPPPEIAASTSSSSNPKSKAITKKKKEKKKTSQWSVYLIISLRLPKTYVGVTTNFSRRLKQHNGELKGGAKASAAGRPWTLACIVRGFKGRSEACEFEYKWKSISHKITRKKYKEDQASNSLLQHRETALAKVTASSNCSHLQIDWQSSSR